MAKYTTQLRTIIEYNSTPGKPITDRIKEAAPKIFEVEYNGYIFKTLEVRNRMILKVKVEKENREGHIDG
jgi:hypothetical protein